MQNCLCDMARDLGVTAVVTKLAPKGLVPMPGARMHADVKISGLQSMIPSVVDVANKSRFAAGARLNYLESGEKKKVHDYAAKYAEGGERFFPFVTGAHGGFGDMAWSLVRLLAERLQVIQGTRVLEGEKTIKTLIQCRIESQIAVNAAKFFRRHEKEINIQRGAEIDEEREKLDRQATRREHERVQRLQDEAINVMLAEEKARAANAALPPMVGAAAAVVAVAVPSTDKPGPTHAEVTQAAQQQIKISIALSKTKPPGLGLGSAAQL